MTWGPTIINQGEALAAVDALTQALRGAVAPPPAGVVRPARALVLGAGGHLGSALLNEALGGGFARVMAVVDEPVASALRGFVPVDRDALASGTLDAETAFIVFERERFSRGRDDAFVRPEAHELLAWARQLSAMGTRRLLVLVPHAPAFLPAALKAGFASTDEAAVAALGFEQLVFLRPAQDLAADPSLRGLRRFAAWWLSQLRWMVPQQQQAVRRVRIAALAVRLAQLLPLAAPGTRVLAPEVLWRAAQPDAADAVLRGWLGMESAPG